VVTKLEKTGDAESDSSSFYLHPEFLLQHPYCLENKIFENPGKMTFEFTAIEPTDFENYLLWLDEDETLYPPGKRIITDVNLDGAKTIPGYAFLQLCRLLGLAHEIDDLDFQAAVSSELRTRIEWMTPNADLEDCKQLTGHFHRGMGRRVGRSWSYSRENRREQCYHGQGLHQRFAEDCAANKHRDQTPKPSPAS
jgi:hypothetical protein